MTTHYDKLIYENYARVGVTQSVASTVTNKQVRNDGTSSSDGDVVPSKEYQWIAFLIIESMSDHFLASDIKIEINFYIHI